MQGTTRFKSARKEAACQKACPAGIDVPRYIRAIAAGKFDESLAVIRESIPFPSVCGYACFAPCEARCGKGQFDEPVAIRALKRAAAEKGGKLWKNGWKKDPSTGKRVAVIGAGPMVEFPDLFVALSLAAYKAFKHLVTEGRILYDPAFVVEIDQSLHCIQTPVPAKDLSVENFGRPVFANTIMLGVIADVMKTLDPGDHPPEHPSYHSQIPRGEQESV
jgi:hypothetical protein